MELLLIDEVSIIYSKGLLLKTSKVIVESEELI